MNPLFGTAYKFNDLPNCQCQSHSLSESVIDTSLYIDTALLPTVDRPKPQRPSTVYTTDGGCDPQFADWECPTYAYDACEHLYQRTGFAEDYLQCLNDKFSACRRGAGCDYQFNLDASDCDLTSPPRPLNELISEACERPDQEYSSREAYQACVDRVTRWANDGCSRMGPDRFGGPTPYTSTDPHTNMLGGPYNEGLSGYR